MCAHGCVLVSVLVVKGGGVCFVEFTHLPGDDGDFGDGRLCEGVQQLGSVSDDAAVLLSRTCGQPGG